MIYARMRVLAWVYAGCDLRYAVCDEVKHRGGSRQLRSISDDRCVMRLRLDACNTYLGIAARYDAHEKYLPRKLISDAGACCPALAVTL